MSSAAQEEYDALSNALAEEYEPQTPTDFYYLNEAIQNHIRKAARNLAKHGVCFGEARDRAGQKAKRRRSSSSAGCRPYSQISKASAYRTAFPFSGP